MKKNAKMPSRINIKKYGIEGAIDIKIYDHLSAYLELEKTYLENKKRIDTLNSEIYALQKVNRELRDKITCNFDEMKRVIKQKLILAPSIREIDNFLDTLKLPKETE